MKKAGTVLVAVAILLGIVPTIASAAEAQPNAGPAGQTANPAAQPVSPGQPAGPPAATGPTGPQELVELRTRDAKHFANPDGTVTAVVGRYLHYQPELGRWDDVDLDLRPLAPTR